MANKKDHGLRNKKLSDELLSGGVYFDWTVTTAFYSAIYFVEDAIFPESFNGVHCNDIKEARIALKVRGRHQTREDLVAQKLPKILFAYKWLDDQSRNARYKTYKVSKGVAEKSQRYLQLIYDECY